MAYNPDIKFNRAWFRMMLFHPAVRADLLKRAQRIAAAAGGADKGYVANLSGYGKRARASVVTTTGEAIRDNASKNTLVRSLDAGR